MYNLEYNKIDLLYNTYHEMNYYVQHMELNTQQQMSSCLKPIITLYIIHFTLMVLLTSLYK